MVEHRFGGAWTEEKLERLRKYLPSSNISMTLNANKRGQYICPTI